MTVILKFNDAIMAVGNAIRALSTVEKYGFSGYTFRSDFPNTWGDLDKQKIKLSKGGEKNILVILSSLKN